LGKEYSFIKTQMEYIFSISIDPKPQREKPSDLTEIGRINKSLQTITGLTISDISSILVKPYSFSWCPAVFNGRRSNENWVSQQVFALDFDGGISPDDVFKRFNDYGIVPNIIYYTFSDTLENRKFRVLVFTDIAITDIEMRNHIQNGLLVLFPEADGSCKDPARFFFGGNTSEVLNPVPVELIKLFDCTSLSQNFGGNNTSTDLLQKRLLLYNIYRNKRSGISNYTLGIAPPKYLINHKNNLSDFNKISEQVKIFRDFLNGEWLHHPQLFGLATNLHWLRGGIKRMKNTMNHFNSIGKTQYTQNNFKILKYVKSMQYLPQSLKNFSPYPEDHLHTNLITSVKDIRGFIQVPEPQPMISLSEGRSRLLSRFNEVLEKDDQKIYILKVPTGIGKTELLTGLDKTVTLCFPTHHLISEVKERMKSPYSCTPNVPVFFEKGINRRIEYLYSIGLFKKVYPYLKFIEKDGSGKYSPADKSLSKNYRAEMETSLKTDKILMTTHQRSLLTKLPHDTVIYDEDPLKSILEIKTLKLTDLFKVERRSKLEDVSVLLDYLKDIPCGVITSNPVFDIDPEKLIEEISFIDISSDIVGILNSLYFIKNKKNPDLISYVSRKDLPLNKKVIILSATIPVKFYERLYGDRVEVFDLSNIEQKGKVIQHTSKSYSRQCMRYSKENISISTDPVITFKEFSENYDCTDINIHFGNAEGVDTYKGKNITVIGTPHLNNMTYLLYGSVMGLNLNTMDNVMTYQMTEWKGYKFKFNCYDHPALRGSQFSLIEGELLQAVGRSRTLTTDAVVNLYSNFPLSITTEFTLDE